MNDYLHQQDVRLEPDSYCIRQLCTTRALSAGDTAFTSDPLATALLASETSQRCHTCFQMISANENDNNSHTNNDTVNALCGGCRYARYCSTACQRVDWPRHRFECRYRQQQQSLPSTRHLTNDPELLLLLRTCHVLLNNNKLSDTLMSERELYRSLPHHRLQHTAWSLDRYGQIADTLLRIAPFTASTPLTKSDLIEEQCRFGCNNFTIVDDRYYPVGVGVYPMASLLNHSCRPNCTYRFDGVQLQVVARQFIRSGEELTISYIDWIYGPTERASQLERQYFFKCQCPRCLDGEDNDSLDRLLHHHLTLTNLISIDDWVAKQMSLLNSLLLQTTQEIISTLLLKSFSMSDEMFMKCQNKWYTTLNATDSTVGPMFSRTILELVGSFMNDQLAKGHWKEASKASRYRLAVYLLVYGRYHPLVPLEVLTLASCLWNKMDVDASQRVIELLETMPLLMDRTHPNAQKYHMPIYEQYKELMEKAQCE